MHDAGDAGADPDRRRTSPLRLCRVAGVMGALLLVDGALRFWKFRRVYAVLQRLSPLPEKRTTPCTDAAGAERLAALVTRTNRRLSPWEVRCLAESLTLWWLLRWWGVRADLRLGVRRILGPLEAHAWVEHEGVPLNDTIGVDRIFEPLDLGSATGTR